MSKPATKISFPKQFLWGAATAAHQVEGGLHNNWTVWELENAKRLAAQAPYQFGDLDNWSKISREATNPNNYVSGRAVDHAGHYADDFKLLKDLGLSAFRFSIEWSRIEPNESSWDQAALDYYKNYIRDLKRMGLVPVVTLLHFTVPVWFAELGGFEKRRNVKYFERFVQKIVSEFGNEFKWVITVNEPEIMAENSYLHGDWPPQKTDRHLSRRVLSNLALAHKRAAKILHAKNKRIKVSIATNSSYIYPGDDAWLTRLSAGWRRWWQDDRFLRKTIKSCDFLGVNYYFSDRVYGYRVHNPEDNLSDVGWSMQPENLQYVLERLYRKYRLPIMITENGVADSSDEVRKWWLVESIKAMSQAQAEGVKLLGYLHWSFLDNFEWDKGFWPKFGLFSVDRRTMKRTARSSAKWYGAFVGKLAKK